jgi:hypothetical protein
MGCQVKFRIYQRIILHPNIAGKLSLLGKKALYETKPSKNTTTANVTTSCVVLLLCWSDRNMLTQYQQLDFHITLLCSECERSIVEEQVCGNHLKNGQSHRCAWVVYVLICLFSVAHEPRLFPVLVVFPSRFSTCPT